MGDRKQLNKIIIEKELKDVVLLFTDVKALYPSLLASASSKIASNMLLDSDLVLLGMDWEEAALYLVLTPSKEESDKMDMSDVMPKRKKVGRTHPGITTAEVRRLLQTPNNKSLFRKGSRAPNLI